jgi:septum formation protein
VRRLANSDRELPTGGVQAPTNAARQRALEAARQRPLVLASASPRRAELLRQARLEFEVRRPQVHETRAHAGEPAALALRRAQDKARAVAARVPGRLVLGADTVVVLDGRILGKPSGPTQAVQMLAALSGRWHRVITGLAVAAGDGEQAWLLAGDTVATEVRFRELAADEIEAYVATGEPLDKAGAYGIQGRGALLVRELRGCYCNVVGLPLSRLGELLRETGWRTGVPATTAARPPSDVSAEC